MEILHGFAEAVKRINPLAVNSAIVSGFISASVLAGFGFDVLIATRFGLGAAADAYFAAVTLPVVVLSGVLIASQSVLVVALTHSPQSSREGDPSSHDLLSSLLTLAMLIGVLLTGLGVLGAPWLIHLLFPGFDSASRQLTISLTQWLFLRVPAAMVAETLRPALYARRRFAPAVAGNLIDSLVALAVLYFLPGSGILVAAWAITIGSWVEMLWLIGVFVFTRSGVYHPRLNFSDPALHKLGRALTVSLGGLLFQQGVTLAERWFGSLLGPGSVAALGYANKIVRVLGGVVFYSVNTAGLPSLTRALASRHVSRAKQEWRRLLTLNTLAAVPLCVGLAAFSRPLAEFLFASGNRSFTSITTTQMAMLLAIYSLSLLPLGPFRAQQSYLFAAGRPVSVGELLFLATLVTLVFDWPLVRLAGAPGLGLSFTLGLIVAMIAGLVVIRRHIRQLE